MRGVTDERAGRTLSSPTPMQSLAEALALAPRSLILDVRDAAAFARGHLPGAGHVGADEFVARRMELPARDVPLLVVHDEPAVAREAAEALVQHGFARVTWLDAPLSHVADGLTSREPAARLWSPSSFVERVCAQLPPGRALDLACGSGRAAVWLALAGWQVEAWDIDESALQLATALAARHEVAIATRAVDLEASEPAGPEQPFDLVVVVRYLHRALNPWIERAVAPGGSLVYETFLSGQRRFGPPRKPRHLLEPGELRAEFPSLEVIGYEESTGEAPPVMARLHARRAR